MLAQGFDQKIPAPGPACNGNKSEKQIQENKFVPGVFKFIPQLIEINASEGKIKQCHTDGKENKKA